MGNVIKSRLSHTGQSYSGIRPLDLELIDRPAHTGEEFAPDDPLAEARQQAEFIINAAQAEAEAIREQAYAEGFATGAEDFRRVSDQLIERLNTDLEALAAERARLIDEVEPELLKLCIEAVEKIIRHEIRTDPRVVLRTIESLLRRVKDGSDLSIWVSPEEIEFVRAHRDEILSVTDSVQPIRILDDRRVDPGGCILECSSGRLDARIKTQIDRLANKLQETYNNDRQQNKHRPDEIQTGDQQD